MYLSNEKILRDSKRFLKRTEEYKDKHDYVGTYEIDYVLKKNASSPEKLPDVKVMAVLDDEAIWFNPYGKEDTTPVVAWDFSYDTDIFNLLEDQYEIVDLSLSAHYGIWSMIDDTVGCDKAFEHPKGLQIYLAYCKVRGITKETFDKEFGEDFYDGVDVMQLYDGKTKHIGSKTKPNQDQDR